MDELLQKSLTRGLEGKYSHIDPLEAIEGIDVSLARKKVEGATHTIWQLLHHIVVWQEIFIENIKGKEANWQPTDNWPSEETMEVDENFYKLLDRYKEGIKEIKELIKTIDFYKMLSFWEDDPVIQFIIIAITHNSYHIGQIMSIKRSEEAKLLKE